MVKNTQVAATAWIDIKGLITVILVKKIWTL